MSDNETLADRLIGKYEIGPNAEFGHRDYSDSEFIKPINIEASKRILELEAALNVIANDPDMFTSERLAEIASDALEGKI